MRKASGQDDRGGVVAGPSSLAGVIVTIVRIIAEREVRALPAAAEFYIAVGADLGADLGHRKHVHTLGRVVRWDSGLYATVVRILPQDRLESRDDYGSSIVTTLLVVVEMGIVAQGELIRTATAGQEYTKAVGCTFICNQRMQPFDLIGDA